MIRRNRFLRRRLASAATVHIVCKDRGFNYPLVNLLTAIFKPVEADKGRMQVLFTESGSLIEGQIWSLLPVDFYSFVIPNDGWMYCYVSDKPPRAANERTYVLLFKYFNYIFKNKFDNVGITLLI